MPGKTKHQLLYQPQHLQLVQEEMQKAYKVLGCKGYVRIDCFYQSATQSPTGTERVIILEVNSLPGMTPATAIFHQAAELGIKPMDFIDMIIQFGLEEHGHATKTSAQSAQPVYASHPNENSV